MTEIELYKEIGGWIRTFHTRNYFYRGLLKDFQHDCFLKLHGKTVNREYVKQTCKYLPWNLMRSTYAKKMKLHSEYVLLDSHGHPNYEFMDWSQVPTYEIPVKTVKVKPRHKDSKKIVVKYRNGEVERFDSVKELGDKLEFKDFRSLYRHIGKPLTKRFTNRKMSHIDVINYADQQPI
jgi:hypothetical protein